MSDTVMEEYLVVLSYPHAALMQQLSKHEREITNLRVATAFEAV